MFGDMNWIDEDQGCCPLPEGWCESLFLLLLASSLHACMPPRRQSAFGPAELLLQHSPCMAGRKRAVWRESQVYERQCPVQARPLVGADAAGRAGTHVRLPEEPDDGPAGDRHALPLPPGQVLQLSLRSSPEHVYNLCSRAGRMPAAVLQGGSGVACRRGALCSMHACMSATFPACLGQSVKTRVKRRRKLKSAQGVVPHNEGVGGGARADRGRSAHPGQVLPGPRLLRPAPAAVPLGPLCAVRALPPHVTGHWAAKAELRRTVGTWNRAEEPRSHNTKCRRMSGTPGRNPNRRQEHPVMMNCVSK